MAMEHAGHGMDHGKNMLQRLAMGGARPRMAVIGPAQLLQFVSKDSEKIVTKVIGESDE